MADTNPATQLMVWLTMLGGRIRELRQSLGGSAAAWLEKEATACESALQNYYGYALQHRVDLVPMYSIIMDLHEQLAALRKDIERKKEPRWKRVLVPLVKAAAWVLGFLGLPGLAALATRALESGDLRALPPPPTP